MGAPPDAAPSLGDRTVAPAAVIAADGLTKRYGDVLAVDHVALRVRPGQIYALLGLNGAGKSTLIRMLLGMVHPSGGSLTVLGAAVRTARADLWSRIGYLVETPVAYPELTVRENLDLTRRLRRLSDRGAVDAVLDRLSLVQYADRRAGTLSLGNGQRLGLAKALIHQPDLLILDEPTNGLDPAGVVEVRAMLHDLATRHGTTIFLSSHLLTEVARTADRIGIIHHGRLLRELDTEDLPTHTRSRLLVSARDLPDARGILTAAGFACETLNSATLAVPDPRAVEHPDDIATLLVRAGCPPTRLAVDREDLEQYFIRLTGGTGAHR
jgi:ABC-2 type transport system ATP-binding protein